MPKITVKLRKDQTFADIREYPDDVRVYTPHWITPLMEQIQSQLTGVEVVYVDHIGEERHETLSRENLTLGKLIGIARNETANVSGSISFSQFEGLDESLVIAIKDLIRNVIIISPCKVTAYGGYPTSTKIIKYRPPIDAIICDQIALQFQVGYNSGRLVLVGDNLPRGLLDDEIFQAVVGRPRYTTEKCATTKSKLLHAKHSRTFGGRIYFDAKAYIQFVKQDFMLYALAVNDFAGERGIKATLKFLKYGTGFFAGNFRVYLSQHIYRGIYAGLQLLLESNRLTNIKSLKLPFYEKSDNPVYAGKIERICLDHNITCMLSKKDALFVGKTDELIATTNCADPHAPTGNEMSYGSVDAAIAENLLEKSKQFNPNLNPALLCSQACRIIDLTTLAISHTEELATRDEESLLTSPRPRM
jgi:hypothetical protein